MNSAFTTFFLKENNIALLSRLLLYMSEIEIEMFSRSLKLRCISLILGFYCNLLHKIDEKQKGIITRAMKKKRNANSMRG